MPPLRFVEPLALWLLAGPALLLPVWCWQLARRRRAVRRLRASRTAPVAGRPRFAGGLAYWLAVTVAAVLVILALAIHSVLDRRSLRAVAQAGGGRYFELGSEPDHVVALRILSDAQRSARGVVERRESFTDLYWGLLLAAAVVLGAATLLIEERAQLWWQLAAAGALGAALLP